MREKTDMNSDRSILKDSAMVIVISLAIAALSSPLENNLPILLKLFVSRYASIVGYLFICYLSARVEKWHLCKVSLAVWGIITPIYILMYWNVLGTKYSLKNIVSGGLRDEIISVIVGASTYLIAITIKSTINVKSQLVKPNGLKETTLLMGIFNMAGLIFIDPNQEYIGTEIFLFVVLITISYLLLWYYWQGNNSARIIVIMVSVMSLGNLYGIKKYSFLQTSIIVAEAALGLFLLWWLNTESVKTYFGKSKKSA